MASSGLDHQYYAYLASRIRKGDGDAFSELYNATYKSLYRYAYYFLKDHDVVQDALQEIYISVYKNIGSLKMDKLLLSWMKQIAYHVCCDFSRQMKNRQARTADLTDENITYAAPASDDCFQPVYDRDTSQQMNSVLSKLPVKVRQAFLLRFEQGLKLEEIADFMDISLSSTKRYINTAREALQKNLAQIG